MKYKNHLTAMLAAALMFAQDVVAQKNDRINRYADLTLSAGSDQFTTALSYNYNWKLGKKQKWEIGMGLRYTGYFGKSIYFKTAPASITSGQTGPGVLFAEDIAENIDSLLIDKSQSNFINLTFNAGYRFNTKWSVGFNIDVIGFGFGATKPATYYGNNFATGVPTTASPSNFNLLLISDNDLGSLNSEFFLKYQWNSRWAVKGAFQFQFVEYNTPTKVQTTPDGQTNDRFRQKASVFGLGVAYQFK